MRCRWCGAVVPGSYHWCGSSAKEKEAGSVSDLLAVSVRVAGLSASVDFWQVYRRGIGGNYRKLRRVDRSAAARSRGGSIGAAFACAAGLHAMGWGSSGWVLSRVQVDRSADLRKYRKARRLLYLLTVGVVFSMLSAAVSVLWAVIQVGRWLL